MCVCVSVFPHAHVHACLCGRPPSPRSERCLCLPLTSVQRSPVPGADSCRQPLPVCSSHLAECGCVCMLVQPLSDCQARGDFLAALVHVASADAMGTLLPPHSSAPVLNTADPPGAHGAETRGTDRHLEACHLTVTSQGETRPFLRMSSALEIVFSSLVITS